MEIVKVKCDKNLKLLLPILQNKINNPESSSESYEESSTSDDSESFDSEMFNFNKELDSESILFLLNVIGQTYSSTDGFSVDKSICFNDDTNKDLVNSLIEESKEEGYYIDKVSDNEFLIELDFFMEKAIIAIPYTTIIIKYNKHFNISCECNVKWIMIDDEHSQIIISSNNKKLTIDDILYVTQIISVTYGKVDFMVTTNVQEFELLQDNDNTLILKY